MASTWNDSTRINAHLNYPQLSAIFGSAIISVWTLIRFFNHGLNFDQVGQQVLSHQWLQGLHDGSVIGPTNYMLKMLFIYMPLDLINLSAQLKLIIATLAINVLTYLLIVYTLQKIWMEFHPKVSKSFYASAIFFSLIAGSVFWISFANSRNLEVAGGLYLLYLCLHTLNYPSRLYYCLIILVGGLLFFADPLQIYMSLLPVLIFISARWGVNRNTQGLRILIKIICCSLAAILLSRLLKEITTHLGSVSFISTNQPPHLSVDSVKLGVKQTARLYTGGFEGGRIREAVNLLVLIGGFVSAAYVYLRQPKARWLIGLAATVWVVDFAVYIISGQSLQPNTNRYLIMTAPFFILMLTAVLHYLPKKKLFFSAFLAVLSLNLITLGGAFVNAWNPNFTNNNHPRWAINYINSNHYSFGYGSINTALAADFLSNEKTKLLPLGCEPNHTLKKTILFFDKAGFDVAKQQSLDSLVPIILDDETIKINQAACAPDQIRSQLGQEAAINHLGDGSTVLLYKVWQLKKLPF